MTIKLTPASFINGLKQSGLLVPEKVDALIVDLERAGVDCRDTAAISQALVQRRVITDWQADKLKQGRHKGFILGRYKLLSLLGAGEMSAVYLAEHLLMERRCAIKVLPANRVQDTSYLGRFHREARAVAALNHANIVRAYDVDKQIEGGTDIHFLVMEYVEGRNLDKIVKEQGPLEFVAAVDIIRQAADGLQHAHTAGLVHRDVKPENLLIDTQGIVKLLDMGLARFFKATEEESLTIKHDEKVLGTADYLAPEQAIDSHKVDSRADIYSLGCSLYFALTGHPPFTDGSLVQRLMAHQTRKPPAVTQDRPDCPASLREILEKMMAKRPDDRYQSAGEVSEALSRWLVEFAPAEWKQRHLMLVASLCGVEALQPKPVTVVPADAAPAEEKPVVPVAVDAVTVADHILLELAGTQESIELVEAPKKTVRAASSPKLPRSGPPRPKKSNSAAMSVPSAAVPRPAPKRAVATAPVITVTPQPPVVAAIDQTDWERRGWVALMALALGMFIWIGVWALNRHSLTALDGLRSNDSANSTAVVRPVELPDELTPDAVRE